MHVRLYPFVAAPLLAMLTIAVSITAHAADGDGRFMVKGGGRASCAEFLAAHEARDDALVSLAGWVDGYLTHVNEATPETFDAAPWQSTELLLGVLTGWCRERPEERFHTAVFQLTRSLYPQRVQARSPLVEVRVGEQALVLYRATIEAMQARLRLRGLLSSAPSGVYDTATTEAIRSFQRAQDLPVTGLPDQVTLGHLL
ncbi:MAG: peptidoglycan-binding domain-containing protein [Gammaproteobacteria bacterium]